ncbi:hypothetical protein G6F40_013169 [Rhizopus arrhizus]|nr:hypothetical protein G6F40_013169 [Rhizopus arrhizus]
MVPVALADHRFIGFDLSIGDGNDVERGTGGVGRDGHAGHRTGVVGAAGRRPGKRQVHQHRGRLAGAARYRVHQRRATVLGDAARRYIDADGGRVADREGERLQLVVGRRACTVVGDPQGQWIGLRRATGRTAEGVHAVERDAWRQGARFHRIGVRRNAATAIQGQRERIADHCRRGGRRDRQGRILHRQRVRLVDHGPQVVGGAHGEADGATPGRGTRERAVAVQGQPLWQLTAVDCVGIWRSTACSTQGLAEGRAGRHRVEDRRTDHDRRRRRVDDHRHRDRIAVGVGELEDIADGIEPVVAVIDEPAAAGDAQDGTATLRERGSIDGTIPGEVDVPGAGRDVDRHAAPARHVHREGAAEGGRIGGGGQPGP